LNFFILNLCLGHNWGKKWRFYQFEIKHITLKGMILQLLPFVIFHCSLLFFILNFLSMALF
jgi:hypothetical protein